MWKMYIVYKLYITIPVQFDIQDDVMCGLKCWNTVYDLILLNNDCLSFVRCRFKWVEMFLKNIF